MSTRIDSRECLEVGMTGGRRCVDLDSRSDAAKAVADAAKAPDVTPTTEPTKPATPDSYKGMFPPKIDGYKAVCEDFSEVTVAGRGQGCTLWSYVPLAQEETKPVEP